MPRKQLDNEARETVDVHANLDQRRHNMATALKNLPASRHSAEQQQLTREQDPLARNCAPADAQKVESILAGQRKELDVRQSAELSLINAALDAASRIEKSAPNGAWQAEDFLKFAQDLNGNLFRNSQEQLKTQIAELNKTLAIKEAGPRNEQLDDAAETQRQATELLERDINVANSEIQRREALTQNVLDEEHRDQLLRSMTDAANNEKVRGLFTENVLQRLADEALCPGKRLLDQVNETAAIQRVKGEIAERIAVANALEGIKRENKTRSQDRQLFLIEGDRIRDEQGKKLSDGLIVWRDAEHQLQIWKALEVKSGPHAARELNVKIEKLTEAQDKELRKYALDLARKEVAKQRGLTAAQRTNEIERVGKEKETMLRSRQVQKEAGQREQTTERLDLTERIYIDGQAHQVAVDRERRLSDMVSKLSTDNALRRDTEVQRLGIRSKELEAIARAFVRELFRQREAA